MLSRVAERIYWMARYLERVENAARQIGVYAKLMLDLPYGVDVSWYNLVTINNSEALFAERYTLREERNVVKFLLADDTNPGSILSSLRMVRENVRTTREVIPSELWEEVNELHHFASEQVGEGINRRHRHEYLSHLIRGCQQIQGLLNGTMSHYSGWEFLRLGRNLERIDMTTRILDTGAALMSQAKQEEQAPLQRVVWVNVLRSVSANQAYRQAIRTRVRGPLVTRFLLTDRHFPRSAAYCLERMKQAAGNLPRHKKPLREINALRRDAFADVDFESLGEPFHTYLDGLQLAIADLHHTFAANWFALQRRA